MICSPVARPLRISLKYFWRSLVVVPAHTPYSSTPLMAWRRQVSNTGQDAHCSLAFLMSLVVYGGRSVGSGDPKNVVPVSPRHLALACHSGHKEESPRYTLGSSWSWVISSLMATWAGTHRRSVGSVDDVSSVRRNGRGVDDVLIALTCRKVLFVLFSEPL